MTADRCRVCGRFTRATLPLGDNLHSWCAFDERAAERRAGARNGTSETRQARYTPAV